MDFGMVWYIYNVYFMFGCFCDIIFMDDAIWVNLVSNDL